MTIRLDSKTKAALDIFAAKWLASHGKALTNDEAVIRLLEIADPDSLKQASINPAEIKRRKKEGNGGK